MNDVLGGHVDLIAGSAALVTAQLGTNMLRPVLQLGRERYRKSSLERLSRNFTRCRC